MAELNEKFRIQNNKTGTIEPVKLYTTIAELIPDKQYLPLEVDGVGNAYAQLDEVGAVNPTRGRFYRNADGKTYQICSQAAVPYGEQAYTTPGTYTFTVPANVTKVKVAMCGGGSLAGGGPSSSFGSYLVANASTKGKGLMTSDYELSVDEIMSYRKTYSSGYKLGFDEVRESNGYGYGYSNYWRSGGGGSSSQVYHYTFWYPGEFKSSYIDTAPNETISCTVANAFNSGSIRHETGGGFILIGWGGEIR